MTPKQAADLRSMSGQSSIEYVVVCAALALALGVGMSDNNSVLVQLIDAFRLAYTRIALAYSLP
jgi:hypothetical protein